MPSQNTSSPCQTVVVVVIVAVVVADVVVSVDSNDALYGCTPKFIAELNTMAEAAVVKV